MTNQISTQTISFYGSNLITLKIDDVIYTAVRPIVEALGLSWSTQRRKLDGSSKFNCVHMNTVTNGGIQSMLCMPLKKLNGWLFSINPEKVRPDLKAKVIQYQEECFEALYNYWHFGKAERQPDLPLVNPMKEIISREMPVEHWLHLASLWFRLYDCVDTLDKLKDPLEKLGSKYAPHVYSCATEDKITLGILKRILEPVLEGIEAPEYERHYRKALEFLRNYKPCGVGAIAVI